MEKLGQPRQVLLPIYRGARVWDSCDHSGLDTTQKQAGGAKSPETSLGPENAGQSRAGCLCKSLLESHGFLSLHQVGAWVLLQLQAHSHVGAVLGSQARFIICLGKLRYGKAGRGWELVG